MEQRIISQTPIHFKPNAAASGIYLMEYCEDRHVWRGEWNPGPQNTKQSITTFGTVLEQVKRGCGHKYAF